jgi:pyroglutamyl-peptidase
MFVCNQVFYAAMDEAARMPATRAGFIHVPYSNRHAPAGAPSLPLEEIARGLEIAVITGIRSPDDVALVGGTVS